jgi:hypothetical protein
VSLASPSWLTRLPIVGATAQETSSITASYQGSSAQIQKSLNEYMKTLDNTGILELLNIWREGGQPFGYGAGGGGLPFGTEAAILTGNPADDVYAISAGTGEKITPGGALATGSTVSGATPSTLFVADSNGKLQSGPSTSSVASVSSAYAAGQLVEGANNGSDFADAGSTRANLHVPSLTPAACAATSNVTTLSGLNTYDGYTCVAGDLILLTAQTTASQNGLWTAASGAWTRPTEMGTGVVLKARTVAVINGTTNGGTTWLLKTNAAITVDTTAQTWIETGSVPAGVTAVVSLTAPGIGSGIDPTGASDSTTALNALISSAISSGQEVVLPAGTFKISGSLVAALTTSNPNFRMRGQGPGKTIINASATGFAGLDIGPSTNTKYVGPTGYLQDLSVIGSFVPGTSTADYHAGVQLDGCVQFKVENVNVGGFDVGFDLINNCYGSTFDNIRAAFGSTCNIGVRLRTGSQSGDDIHFWNPWLAGAAVASVCIEGNGSDGTSGFTFHGGQYGAGTTSSDKPGQGSLMVGLNYQTGTSTGEIRQIQFYGGDFEATIRQWDVKCYVPCSIDFYGTRFDNNGTGGVGGTAPLGVLSHSAPADDSINFHHAFIGGSVRWQMIDYVGLSSSNGQVLELGTYGKPAVFVPMTCTAALSTGTAVTMSVAGQTITASGAVSVGSSVTVPLNVPLQSYLPSGKVITFSGGGVLTLTSQAGAGATSLAGTLATAAIASGNTATPFGIPSPVFSGQAITFTNGGVLTTTAYAAAGATSLTGNLTTANVAVGETADPGYSCNLYIRSMGDTMGISRSTSLMGGSQPVLNLNGVRLANVGGTLESSTDGITYGALGSSSAGKGAQFASNNSTSIPAATITALNLSNAVFNDDQTNFYDISNTANGDVVSGAIKIKKAGLYLFTPIIRINGVSANATVSPFLRRSVAGGALATINQQAASFVGTGPTDVRIPSAPVVQRCVAGDVIQLCVYATQATTLLYSTLGDTGVAVAYLGS